MDTAKTQRLALPRTVDRQRMHAALRELESGKDDAHLLAVVHAVENHHGRRAQRHTRGLHEQRWQRRSLIRHFDEVDFGMAARQPFAEAAVGIASHGDLDFARRNETFTGVVIIAGTQVIVAGGAVMATRRFGIGGFFDLRRHRTPHLLPGPGFALPALQRFGNAVDLVHRHYAVGRHALARQCGVGPQEIAGEMVNPETARAHVFPLTALR